MSIKFTDICFYTEDVLRLRTFYENIFGGRVEGDETHSTLELKGLTFAFDNIKLSKDNPSYSFVTSKSSNNILIGFNVDNIDIEYQRLLNIGVTMLNQPTSHPWGTRSFQFKDPDGNIINFRIWVKRS